MEDDYVQEKRRVKDKNKQLSQLAQYLKKRAVLEANHAKAIQQLDNSAISGLDEYQSREDQQQQQKNSSPQTQLQLQSGGGGGGQSAQPVDPVLTLLLDSWISFLEADSDLCKTSGQFSRLVLGSIASDVAEFKSQNKKIVDKITSDKTDKEDFLAAMFSRATRAADEKALQSLITYSDRYLEMLEKSTVVVKGLREGLETRREYLQEEDEEDDATIPELLESTPDVDLTPASATFKKVHLSSDLGNKLSGSVTIDLFRLTICFTGKQHSARFEYAIPELFKWERSERR